MKKVSIIIPTKNEPYIQEIIKNIHRVLSKVKHEIIVVDKSNIPPKIKNAKLLIQKSDGLGNAIVEGLEFSNGDIIITMDSDGSHRPEDLPKLIEKTKEFDIVIGSKYVAGGKTEDRWYRRIISRLYCWLASLVLGLGVKDNMSGFAAVRREVCEKIRPNPKGFKINMELLYKAKKGFRVTEVPITFLPRKKGRSRSFLYEILIRPGFKEAFRTIIFIIELKLSKLNLKEIKQFLKFCVVGSLGTVINLAILYGSVEIAKLWYIFGAALAFVIAATHNYILNKIWTFGDKRTGKIFIAKQWIKFFVISVFSLGINLLVLWSLVEFVKLWYIFAQIIAIFIALFSNFLGNKYWTFRIVKL